MANENKDTGKSLATLPPNKGVTNDTQIKQDPIEGQKIEFVTQNITVRTIDRSAKDVSTLQNGLKAAERTHSPNRSRLYNVYEDIIRDGHLWGIIGKRIDAVLNKTLLFKNGDTLVEEMNRPINSQVFRDIITEIILSKLWGIRGMEFQPGKTISFKKIPVKHIKPKWQIITMEEFATEGISYTDLANVWIVGDPDDLGLLLKCGYYALLKKGAIADWAEYIEIFGSPVMIMTYDAGDTQTDLALDKVLDEVGNSMRIKIPKQAGFDMKDGKASNGDGKLQDIFRRAMNEEMSIIILGNTETTNSSNSSGYAQSKTHAEQQLEITRSDMVFVLDYLNSDHFLNILKSYGYPVDGGMFEFDREIDIAYMAKKIEVDKKAKEIGLPIGKKYMYETYAIDEPEAGDEIQGKASTEPVPEPPSDKPKPKPKPENLSDNDDDAPVTKKEFRQMLADFFGPAL